MRKVLQLLPLLLLAAAQLSASDRDRDRDGDEDETLKSKDGRVDPAIAQAPAPTEALVTPPVTGSGFTPQVRVGYGVGDGWEPAIASDVSGNVYVLYPQYGGVPGCVDCPSPTMILQISRDGGATWGAPTQIAAPGTGQWDAQIEVDPADGETVYAAWLQNNKSDIVVARSDDFGVSWSPVVANHTNAGTDKPILAVRGPDVYVAYDHQQKMYVSTSHDGGQSFVETAINPNGKLGLSLANGGVVDPAGRVFFSWDGIEASGQARGKVHLFISRSTDGGATFTQRELDTSAAAPDCSAYLCGWAFLSAQIVMTSDDAGRLYALWNGGAVKGGPERIYFAASADAGDSWSARRELSTAPSGAAHAFPAIVAGARGDVRVAWMDARSGGLWNTWTRRSTDGGASWSAEVDLSTPVSGYDYIQPAGFSFPFGDYFEMSIDGDGDTHVVWGEGLNYDSPGSIWYARGL